jgi:hypothetical protein
MIHLYGPAVRCKPNVSKWRMEGGGLAHLYPALAWKWLAYDNEIPFAYERPLRAKSRHSRAG